MDTIETLYAAQTDGPKYKAVAQSIRQAVDVKVLAEHEKLPPVRDLAWRLQITPGTVARAYSILTEEGVLYAEVGRGTFVSGEKTHVSQRDLNRDRQWERHIAPLETDSVSLFSPVLPDLGQVALIHESYARMATDPNVDLISYPGLQAETRAHRAALRWLSDTDLGPVQEQDMVLSFGSQNGLSLILQTVLKGPKPVILVEELSYPGFRRAARLLRAEIVAVPMDDHGIVPEELDRLARKYDAQVLCTCPDAHNPTGLTTPLFRRREIADVARRNGLHIIEDESYRLPEANCPTYRALLPDLGWFITSISKSLTPALRVGFVIAPRPFRQAIRQTTVHGHFGMAQPLVYATEDLLSRQETFDVMDAIRAEMRRYVHAAVNALGGFDITWQDDVPYIWLRLPEGWRASAFAQAAEAQGVQVRTAEDFVPRTGFAPHAVRMAINAGVSLRSFESAMARLRALLDNPPAGFTV
ncbi:putative HTH-type transcriptional regulator YjiR [Pelagimonas phthalicica]|uniref:Putative HTH-type transcriptional regulator YjiR n=1 Tax=Pelagimonas phthalicica TaxID=1037362 RepID=A0A238JCN5_9RHOB|nr:PLP-dependent aminotransferase family protein [Pelagimonas phthalicica]TDS91411.1 GntR family transcriptional regulator [Pelagimonas phthalicica]SMX28460.1 putative HTH-type transcriptional regulator YjiR [Pelagimonas phthalicica]